MKTLMICPICSFGWWIEAISDVPPGANCPRCFPTQTKTTTTGTEDKPTV